MSKVFACLCMLMLVVSGTAFAAGGEDIATAVPFTVLPFSDTGDTTGALDDYDEACSVSATAPDLVYSYAPAADISVDIDLFLSSYDTKVFVYENTVATPVACDDDYHGSAGGYTSFIGNLALTTGNTYYIVVDGYSSSQGAYQIDITQAAGGSCDDDLIDLGSMACADVITYSGDTTGANNWCGAASGDNHFSVEMLEDGLYTFSLCDTLWDTQLHVYDDACCGNEIAFDDDDCDGPGSGLASTHTMSLVAGTYYVHVDGYSANEGLYDLVISCEEISPCVGPDDCASALLITPGSYAGDTSMCTDTFPYSSLWGWYLNGNDHVYAIDVPCTDSEICVTVTPFDGQDMAVSLATECVDGPVTAIAGADNGISGPEAFCYINTGDEVGTLYIIVDSYGAGSAGAYTLDVTVSAVANDTCDTAIDASAGGTFSGTTACAANDYDGYCGTSWGALAPDVVYSIDVADGDTVDVTMTPLDGQDPILYIVGDCGDVIGSCVVGADGGLGGDAEFVTATFDCAGTYYIICDGWSTAEGAFDLDVVITPGVPVDTFDVSMLCDPDPLTLPVQTKIRVYVTNTFDTARMFCGNVGVTLCNGVHISNLRAGNMVVLAGATKYLGWGQNLPAYPKTCNCTLVFDVEAYDCTPCADAGAAPAGWVETATCGITTVCPE